MAKHGPIPKREAQRRRRNKPEVPVLKAPASGPGAWQQPDPAWHPIAKRMYEALQKSGQSQFFEPSDIEYAYSFGQVTDQLFRGAATRSGKGISPMLLAAWNDMASNLMVSEPDRRRARIELQKGEPVEPPSVAIMAKYRAGLSLPAGTVN